MTWITTLVQYLCKYYCVHKNSRKWTLKILKLRVQLIILTTNNITTCNLKEKHKNMGKALSMICQIVQSIVHYTKCLLIWFVLTKIVGLWMVSLNDDPNVPFIHDSDLVVSYANLSKYENTECFRKDLSFTVSFCIDTIRDFRSIITV